jgi:hypothetical protein
MKPLGISGMQVVRAARNGRVGRNCRESGGTKLPGWRVGETRISRIFPEGWAGVAGREAGGLGSNSLREIRVERILGHFSGGKVAGSKGGFFGSFK